MNEPSDLNESSERELRAKFEQLGLWPIQFVESDDKPEVDLEALHRLARRELPTTSAKLLYQLIAHYRDWYQAYVEILANEQ